MLMIINIRQYLVNIGNANPCLRVAVGRGRFSFNNMPFRIEEIVFDDFRFCLTICGQYLINIWSTFEQYWSIFINIRYCDCSLQQTVEAVKSHAEDLEVRLLSRRVEEALGLGSGAPLFGLTQDGDPVTHQDKPVCQLLEAVKAACEQPSIKPAKG